MKQAIATDPSQSARLQACGVDPKSADMVWQEPITTSQKRTGGKVLVFRNPNHQDYVGDVPAWSLSACLRFLPMEISHGGINTKLILEPYSDEDEVHRWCLTYHDYAIQAGFHYEEADDPIECCVGMIEWVTKENYKLNEIKQ